MQEKVARGEAEERKIRESYGENDQEKLRKQLERNKEYKELALTLLQNQKDLEEQVQIKQKYEEIEQFYAQVNQAMELLMLLLSSKTQQDTIETIRVFKLLYSVGFPAALAGVQKMLNLLFSRDEAV